MADYPTSIYNGRTKENKSGVVFDANKKNVLFAEDLLLLDAEVSAIETILGTDPTGSFETIGAYLSALASAISDIPDSFLELADTPASYVDQAGKVLKVNSAGNALEFGEAGGTPDTLVLPYSYQEKNIFMKPESWIIDDDAIYGLTYAPGRTLIKLNKENLSVIDYSSNSDFQSIEFCSDVDYIYVIKDGYQIKKVAKSNINGYVQTFYTSGDLCRPVLDGDYIYAIDFDNGGVSKINKATGSIVSTVSVSLSWMIPILRQDSNYLYVNTDNAQVIQRISKSTFTTAGTMTADIADILNFDVSNDYLVTCEDSDNAVVFYSLSSFGSPQNWFSMPKTCSRVGCFGDYALVISDDHTIAYFIDLPSFAIVRKIELAGADITSFAFSLPYFMTTFVDSGTSVSKSIKNNFINVNIS